MGGGLWWIWRIESRLGKDHRSNTGLSVEYEQSTSDDLVTAPATVSRVMPEDACLIVTIRRNDSLYTFLLDQHGHKNAIGGLKNVISWIVVT